MLRFNLYFGIEKMKGGEIHFSRRSFDLGPNGPSAHAVVVICSSALDKAPPFWTGGSLSQGSHLKIRVPRALDGRARQPEAKHKVWEIVDLLIPKVTNKREAFFLAQTLTKSPSVLYCRHEM